MLFPLDTTIIVGAIVVAIGAVAAFLVFRWDNNPRRKLQRRWRQQEKEKAEAAKNLKKIEDLKKDVSEKPPQNLVPVVAPVSALEEESIGEFVNFEIGKEKKGKRVTVVRGRIKVRPDRFGRLRDKFLFQWDKGGYFVRLDKLIEVEIKTGLRKKGTQKVRKLVYDMLFSEPLEQDGSVRWDDQLEEILTDAGAGQYIDAASQEGGFQLTPALIRALIVVGLLGSLLGLALNGTAHITPTTIIHWVP